MSGMTQANIATYGPAAITAANNAGVDPQLFLNLIMSESGFDPLAISSSPASNGYHAQGIAQFMPATAADLGVNPFNPFASLDSAAKFLADKINQYGTVKGVAAYKGSPNSPVAQAQAQNVVNGTDSNGNSYLSQFSDILGKALPQYSAANAIASKTAAVTGNAGSQSVGDAFTGYVKSKALGFSLGFVGLLIISIAIIALVLRSGTGKQYAKAAIGTVTKV